MNIVNQHFEFAAPRVPVASPVDGLMPVGSLDQPVNVEIVLGSYISPGHTLQLLLNALPVGDTRIIQEEHPGEVIMMLLDPGYVSEPGAYTLGFRATNPENLVYDDSPTTPIVIDRSAPGSTLLAAIIFPNFNYGEVLRGVIPGYADMQVGDSIQTLCNGVTGPVHTVSTEDLTERPPHVSFSREFLQGLSSENVTFTYQVTDRAGNMSVMSQPLEMSLQR